MEKMVQISNPGIYTTTDSHACPALSMDGLGAWQRHLLQTDVHLLHRYSQQLLRNKAGLAAEKVRPCMLFCLSPDEATQLRRLQPS